MAGKRERPELQLLSERRFGDELGSMLRTASADEEYRRKHVGRYYLQMECAGILQNDRVRRA